MVEVVPARTSPTLLPHPLTLCCDYPVSKCPSASIVVTSTVRVNESTSQHGTRGVVQVKGVHIFSIFDLTLKVPVMAIDALRYFATG